MINGNDQARDKIAPYGAFATPAPNLNQIRVLAEAVNPVIADGFAVYEKTKMFYLHLVESDGWNPEPSFDEQAQEIFDSMDLLAENLRQIGAATIGSFSHMNELQSVESYHSDLLSPDKMIEQLVADNRRIVDSLLAAGRVCKTLSETKLDDILLKILDQTKRRIRFLNEAALMI